MFRSYFIYAVSKIPQNSFIQTKYCFWVETIVNVCVHKWLFGIHIFVRYRCIVVIIYINHRWPAPFVWYYTPYYCIFWGFMFISGLSIYIPNIIPHLTSVYSPTWNIHVIFFALTSGRDKSTLKISVVVKFMAWVCHIVVGVFFNLILSSVSLS